METCSERPLVVGEQGSASPRVCPYWLIDSPTWTYLFQSPSLAEDDWWCWRGFGAHVCWSGKKKVEGAVLHFRSWTCHHHSLTSPERGLKAAFASGRMWWYVLWGNKDERWSSIAAAWNCLNHSLTSAKGRTRLCVRDGVYCEETKMLKGRYNSTDQFLCLPPHTPKSFWPGKEVSLSDELLTKVQTSHFTSGITLWDYSLSHSLFVVSSSVQLSDLLSTFIML